MSYVTRRALSTLIPPKVASPKRVVNFYEKLPRGPAPEVKATGILGRYQAKHFGKNPTAKPIIHAIVALLIIGYAQNYYFHLRAPRRLQTVKIDRDSDNVALDRPHVNGTPTASASDEFENKHIADIIDDLVNSTEVSISGGSDNEAARSDAGKSKDDPKGSSRAVKKPAAFKAINVNKTFLTAKAPAPGAQPKAAEKPPPPTSSSPAPSTPRPVLDPGYAVWNKNRPVPPPEPKKYTDEELKKYGIHMANRLHPDDTKGQSNWADIEDDDEDWAPETITWKDGTKIELTHTDERPSPVPEPARPVTTDVPALEKPKPPAPSASPSIRPGVLASGKGLVLKGAPEKPTLVAKPPAPPTPAKSPWAPLPKIEKVSPIVAAEVPHQPGPRYPPRDTGMYNTNTGPPPKEIAADDFSRAPWREGPSGGNRELFNSQSGRYEPVLDRRGSMRPEPPHGRGPAVLQRPHYDGPMEQMEQQGPYGRRRGSSNVSGGSGSWQRLRGLEHPLPPADLVARRESMTAGSDHPASPGNFPPAVLHQDARHGQAWQPRPSPVPSHATPYQPGPAAGMPSPQPQSAVPVTEDDYELQKRLMRERRELAMRRRQEEEAKEEAARRERIRLKLEALGPAPESNSAKKSAVKDQPKEQAAAPTQIQPREETAPQKPAPAESQPTPKLAPATVVPEPAKQPVPLPNGAPAPLPQSDGPAQPPAGPAHSWGPSARTADRPPAVWGPQPSTRNVWGAPNNNRTLGNGTFVADLGPAQLPGKPGPGPIAPPNGARAAVVAQVSLPAPAPRHPPIGPPRQPQVPPTTADREREAKDNAWAAAARVNDDKFSDLLNAQYEERERRLQAEGRSLVDVQPVIKDTWRPTKIDDTGVRTEGATKQTVHIGQENPWAVSAESKSMAPQPTPSVVSSGPPSEYNQLPQGPAAPSTSILGAPIRGSRFFPSRDIRQEISPEALRHKSPSPPPPDMAGHPAFDGDATHPLVSLPRPYPVVRLPPSAPQESAESSRAAHGQQRQGPSFAWAAQTAYKDEIAPRVLAPTTENAWQAKIDNLLGGRKVHPRPRSSGTDGARALHYESASPGLDASVTSKDRAEECFDQQEMGSLPPVRLPKVVPDVAWQLSPAPKPLPRKLYPATTTVDPISFPVDMSGAGPVWHIILPGHESKSITVPFGRTRSNPRRGGQRGNRHATSSSSQRQQGKSREPSSYPAAEQGGGGAQSSEQPSTRGRNSRGGYRGRGGDWSRNASSAQSQA
ncbi:hypothetical protein N0V88_004976 [Collariella sp. IMI 366227]|nr:hypothetical protein N0V88_004976 [Collariella sp. IMI 366227]